MRKIEYDAKDSYSGNTETHIAVDEMMERRDQGLLQKGYNEGFSSASGVRNETAETGGRVKNPEIHDEDGTNKPVTTIDKENAGLADS